MVQVQNKLAEILKQPLPVTTLFQYPTIQALACYLSQSSKPTESRDRSHRVSKQKEAIRRQKQQKKRRKNESVKR